MDDEDKSYYRSLSRIRVKVEQVFGELKTLKILSDRF